MEKHELLERYEALGEERDFLAARPLYKQALAEGEDARLLNDYGYLLACHARRELRLAAEAYERAIALDPSYDKPHNQLILARASLLEPERSVTDAGASRRGLVAMRGEANAALGDLEGALFDWRLALELEPEGIGALYSSAFLLERERRLDEAAAAWEAIIAWNEERGFALETVWPKQELKRVWTVPPDA